MKRAITIAVLSLLFAVGANAQSGPAKAWVAPITSTDGKVYLYVSDNPTTPLIASREIELQGEAVKDCPAYIAVTIDQSKSDYTLIFQRDEGKRSMWFNIGAANRGLAGGLAALALSSSLKVDKATLTDHDKVIVWSGKRSTLQNVVTDACNTIPAPILAPPPPPAAPIVVPTAPTTNDQQVITAEQTLATTVDFTSDVANAEIDIDGKFVGNVPSVVFLTPGDHLIVIAKAGYISYERTITITNGTIEVHADLLPLEQK